MLEIKGDSNKALKLVQQVFVAHQAKGCLVALVDCCPDDNAVDLLSFRDAGVDNSRMLLSQPSSAKQALDVIESLVRSKMVAVVAVRLKWRWPHQHRARVGSLVKQTGIELLLVR